MRRLVRGSLVQIANSHCRLRKMGQPIKPAFQSADENSNAPRKRIIFILGLLNCIDIEDRFEWSAYSDDRHAFDKCLSQPTD